MSPSKCHNCFKKNPIVAQGKKKVYNNMLTHCVLKDDNQL